VREFFGPETCVAAVPARAVTLEVTVQDGPPIEPVNPRHDLSVLTADPIVIDTGSSRCEVDPHTRTGVLTLARADLDNPVVWGRWILERLFLYLICRSPRSYPLHAGAVEVDGRVAVLAAAGGVGKSTFTHWALHRGARLIGEDILARDMDEPGGALWGYPRALYLAPGMIARSSVLAGVTAVPVDGAKCRVTLPDALADQLLPHARPSCLVFLVRGDGAGPRTLTVDNALDRCREDYATAKDEQALAAVEDDLRALLAGLPVWEIEVSDDLDESYDRLRAALATLPVAAVPTRPRDERGQP
jgi:hypothetical protein